MLPHALPPASFDWPGSPSIWPTHVLPGNPGRAVRLARGALSLALAIFVAASQGLPLLRLIVARAIPIASQAFATVALQRSVGGAAAVITAIIVDTMTAMAPILTVNVVAVSIVMKSNLVSGAMATPAIGGLAEPSVELLRSFAKERLADTIRLLAFDRTIKLFLLEESPKKAVTDSIVLLSSFLPLNTNFSRLLLWYDM